MIYEFSLPVITDTKNLKKTFAKSKLVSPDGLSKLNEIVNRRAIFKQSMSDLLTRKTTENVPSQVMEGILAYPEHASSLEKIFTQSYKIDKNIKWTPLFSTVKVLKFSKDIKFGMAGEIVMAHYSAFSVKLRKVNADLNFIKSNFHYNEGDSLQADANFSVIKQVDPKITKLREASHAVLEQYVDSYLSLQHDNQKLAPLYQLLSSYPGAQNIESKGICVEVALLCLKINANSIQVESLRRRANIEAMGKYAKSIVRQAQSLDSYLSSYSDIDPALVKFAKVSSLLYKAIALWSFLPSFLAKVQTQSYATGENMNMLAGACVGFIDEIARIHKKIKEIPKLEDSPYNWIVAHYFTQIFVPNASKVTTLYGDLYKTAEYDDGFFQKLEAHDFIDEQLHQNMGPSKIKY